MAGIASQIDGGTFTWSTGYRDSWGFRHSPPPPADDGSVREPEES